MSWISFWIKPEAVPARVTLCVTSLLTLSTQHAQSQKSLPPVSYIKAIDIFMSSCTVFVFASLMEYALVNILMSDELLNGWIGMMGDSGREGYGPVWPQTSVPVPGAPQVPTHGIMHRGPGVSTFIRKESLLILDFMVPDAPHQSSDLLNSSSNL